MLAAVSFGSLDNASDLGRLDPATGVLTRLGPTGFRLLFGVKFDAAFRTLYAITGFQVPPVLVALDPATGQGTAIAQTDLPTRPRPWRLRRTAAWSWPAATATSTSSIRSPAPRR